MKKRMALLLAIVMLLAAFSPAMAGGYPTGGDYIVNFDAERLPGNENGFVETADVTDKLTAPPAGTVQAAVFYSSLFSSAVATPTDITGAFECPNFLAAVREITNKPSPQRIYDTDVNAITHLDVNERNITSLAGIEHFAALQSLIAYYNSIETLDVSSLPLVYLGVENNQLNTLVLPGSGTLQVINASGNNLTELDLSSHTALSEVFVWGNQLRTLALPASGTLRVINVDGNDLTELDLSSHTALLGVFATANSLHSDSLILPASANALIWLNFSYNLLTSLDVSGFPALRYLYVPWNEFRSLDVSNNPQLELLNVRMSQFTELDLSNNPLLRELHAHDNLLTELDLSSNPRLELIDVRRNNFTNQSDIIGLPSGIVLQPPDDSFDFMQDPGLYFHPQRTINRPPSLSPNIGVFSTLTPAPVRFSIDPGAGNLAVDIQSWYNLSVEIHDESAAAGDWRWSVDRMPNPTELIFWEIGFVDFLMRTGGEERNIDITVTFPGIPNSPSIETGFEITGGMENVGWPAGIAYRDRNFDLTAPTDQLFEFYLGTGIGAAGGVDGINLYQVHSARDGWGTQTPFPETGWSVSGNTIRIYRTFIESLELEVGDRLTMWVDFDSDFETHHSQINIFAVRGAAPIPPQPPTPPADPPIVRPDPLPRPEPTPAPEFTITEEATVITNPQAPGFVTNAVEAVFEAAARADEVLEQVVLELPEGRETISFHADTLDMIAEAEADLVVVVGDVAVNLPVALLGELTARGGSIINISVAQVTNEDDNVQVSVNFATTGNRQMGGFTTPVQIIVDLSDRDIMNPNPNRVVALDRSGRPIGGTYNPRTRLFTVDVAGTATFTIEMVSDLVRLRLSPGSTVITDIAGNVPAVRMDAAPVIQDGTLFVPVSFIGTALGFGAEWNPYTQEVTLSQGARSFTFGVDHPCAQLIDGGAFVTLDFAGQLFGAFVGRSADGRVIEVIAIR